MKTFPVALLALPALLATALLFTTACESDPGRRDGAATATAAATTAAAVVGSAADWCAGHGVPESKCTICNPELEAAFRAAGDWCAGHSLPESVCPLCGHGVAPPPELAASSSASSSAAAAAAAAAGGVGSAADWCAGHGVPESKCTICNPELEAAFRASGDWCAEHALPESVCPACNPDLAGGSVAGFVIRFKDERRERAAGLILEPVGRSEAEEVLEAPVRIDHDRNRLARVSAPIGGVVSEVLVDLGDSVSAGVELFLIESLEVARARRAATASRSAIALARSAWERERLLEERGIGSAVAVERARGELDRLRAELAGLEALLELAGPPVGGGRGGDGRGGRSGGGDGSYAVRAPSAGTVIERPAMLGFAAAAGQELALLSDVQSAWAWADVTAERALDLHEGLWAEVIVPGLDGRPASGEVTWISPEVDERTRTVAVRIQLDDPDDRLRLNQYGRARIALPGRAPRLVVPAGAVQLVDKEAVVFVKTAALTYETRVVSTGRMVSAGRVGESTGRVGRGQVEVQGALGAGDPVVSVGAYLLKTELRRDSIGAGCCEVDSLGDR